MFLLTKTIQCLSKNTVCVTTSRIVLKVHDCKGRKKNFVTGIFYECQPTFLFRDKEIFHHFMSSLFDWNFKKLLFFFCVRDRKGLFYFEQFLAMEFPEKLKLDYNQATFFASLVLSLVSFVSVNSTYLGYLNEFEVKLQQAKLRKD